MEYKDFINKKIINKNNEEGVIQSYDKDYIVIKYSNSEKTYSSNIAFSSGFLTIKDDSLMNQVNENQLQIKELNKKKEETIKETNRKYLLRKKKVNETYKWLLTKSQKLRALFGPDFIYPPLVEFEKKYKYLIEDNKRHGSMENIIARVYGYHTFYYY